MLVDVEMDADADLLLVYNDGDDACTVLDGEGYPD
jgi:hypothetical protein